MSYPSSSPSKIASRGKGRSGGFACRQINTLRGSAFTLVEILVACAVLILLLVMLLSVTSQTMSTLKTATDQIDAFQTARTAFDSISQRISQAKMNTYWDYYDSGNARRTPQTSSSFQPARYGRASDLQFLIQNNTNSETNSGYGQSVFFAAPEAISADSSVDQTQGLLNAIGYFVQYGNDDAYRPSIISKQRYRYRLMQAIQPTENLMVFNDATNAWTTGVRTSAWPLAENVIALIVWPRLNLIEDPSGQKVSSNYEYDSRTLASSDVSFPIQYAQAPPVVQLTMVAIDESSAIRLDSGAAEPAVIGAALAGKFTHVTDYQSDLDSLQKVLSKAHVNFRILNTFITLRESKWSAQ